MQTYSIFSTCTQYEGRLQPQTVPKVEISNMIVQKASQLPGSTTRFKVPESRLHLCKINLKNEHGY